MGPIAVLLLLLIRSGTVVSYWEYESLNVSQWQWQSSVVVNNWLYIDGGELYAIQNDNPTFFYLGQTISIDLTQPWTNATVQNYLRETQRSVTDGHWSKKPALFYDPFKNVVIQWGGCPYDNDDQSYEFVFTPNGNGTVNWIQSATPVTNTQDKSSPAIFGSAFVSSSTSFYSLGGVVAEESAPPELAVQGLLEYNFEGSNWTNSSSEMATANGYLVGGQAAYTPGSDQGGFGQAGYIFFVGGNDPASQSFDPQSPSLVDMSNITLYDIGAQAWYQQATTGTTPPPRQFFCSVSATSIQATFEIFILGGSTNETYDQALANDTDYLSVYTLSIPAFRWFKSTATDQVRRANQCCQLIGNKQMLVIGGTQPSNPLGIAAVEPWPNGLGIFDMSNFTWADSYDPQAAPYEQPAVVRDYYSNEYQSPVWGSSQLQVDFAWAPPDVPTGTYTGSYPSTTTSPALTASASTKASSSSTPIGPIVGGVVGGVCALLLALILGVLVWKRKNPKTMSSHEVQTLEVSNITTQKVELPTPLNSPGLRAGVPPSYTETRASGRQLRMEEPEAQELEATSVIRTPEMP